MMKSISLTALLSLFLPLAISPHAGAVDEQNLETVARVDLDRYAGTWYEIARLPNRFQDHCIGNVTADYRQLENGRIEVINRCRDGDGAADEAVGVARIVDAASNAKLEVSFVSLCPAADTPGFFHEAGNSPPRRESGSGRC
jgi:apolipoprotein D and lipocalin family protein